MVVLSKLGSEKILSKPIKLFSLVLVIDLEQDKILLGLKKRGFGVGKWNGFGGTV
jgi:hypothetical protein